MTPADTARKIVDIMSNESDDARIVADAYLALLARPEAVTTGKRLVYNKATKRIDVVRHDGLVLDSFEPPQECDEREPHGGADK